MVVDTSQPITTAIILTLIVTALFGGVAGSVVNNVWSGQREKRRERKDWKRNLLIVEREFQVLRDQCQTTRRQLTERKLGIAVIAPLQIDRAEERMLRHLYPECTAEEAFPAMEGMSLARVFNAQLSRYAAQAREQNQDPGDKVFEGLGADLQSIEGQVAAVQRLAWKKAGLPGDPVAVARSTPPPTARSRMGAKER